MPSFYQFLISLLHCSLFWENPFPNSLPDTHTHFLIQDSIKLFLFKDTSSDENPTQLAFFKESRPPKYQLT